MRYSLILFAVLRCSGPPHVPLFKGKIDLIWGENSFILTIYPNYTQLWHVVFMATLLNTDPLFHDRLDLYNKRITCDWGFLKLSCRVQSFLQLYYHHLRFTFPKEFVNFRESLRHRTKGILFKRLCGNRIPFFYLLSVLLFLSYRCSKYR